MLRLAHSTALDKRWAAFANSVRGTHSKWFRICFCGARSLVQVKKRKKNKIFSTWLLDIKSEVIKRTLEVNTERERDSLSCLRYLQGLLHNIPSLIILTPRFLIDIPRNILRRKRKEWLIENGPVLVWFTCFKKCVNYSVMRTLAIYFSYVLYRNKWQINKMRFPREIVCVLFRLAG